MNDTGMSKRAGRGVVPSAVRAGRGACRARCVPSEVGVRGVAPPACPRRACVGAAGAQQATTNVAAVGVAPATAAGKSSTRRRCAGRAGVCARVFASWGPGLGAGQVRRARARARGARGIPERGSTAPAGAQRDVGRACRARTKARPRGSRAADGRGRAWEMMAPSRAQRRAQGREAGPLPCGGDAACARVGRRACGRIGGEN